MTDRSQDHPTVEEMQAAADVFSAGRYVEAAGLAQKLVDRFPEHPFGWKLLGTIYAESGRHTEALAALRAAGQINPPDAEVHNNLGSVLIDVGQFDAAKLSCRRALDIKPDFQQAYCNMGYAQISLGEFDQAIDSFRRAISIAPRYADAYSNLGNALKHLGQFDDASANYRRALEINPDFHSARWNLGLALLAQGRYDEGWSCYESRTAIGDKKILTVPDLPFPCWRGEPLQGKSLLLWPEQGFGDYVQFIRYASLLKGRGVSRLTVRCSAPLKDLLATAASVDAVITDAEPVPSHDYWSFPLSLPLHFGTTVESIPASLPYLHALPDRIENWRARLSIEGPKVGLVWKGSSGHSNDGHRSLPGLDSLRPLWRVPGVSFVSLQKGAGEDEARSAGLPIVHLGSDVRDFADTAAIVDQLDLVICVDTAVAHVAGALGKPCWVLLPAIGCDWRWMQDRSDSPWYPGALQLFRQKERGDWSGVIDDVVIALRDLDRFI